VLPASPVVALLLMAAGCDAWLTKPSLYNSVTVVVSQRNGAPVAGVALSLYTGQRPMGYATTGADGRYVFQDVPQGNYGVFATPPDGYDVLEHFIQAPSSIFHDGLIVADDTLAPVRFTFLKKGPGSVSVHLTDPTAGDLRGVPVTLYSPQAVEGKAVTDAGGRATFANVPFGVHGVLVERPFLYRDYITLGDSLYSHRDDIIVDDGAADTATFQLKRCAGTMRAVLVDDAGLPVPNTTVLFYTPTLQLNVAASGPSGIVLFSPAPCATQLGMFITPGAGYTVAEGRGSRFIDGLTVTNGATAQATFRVHKQP
jgi:hypothetical protein